MTAATTTYEYGLTGFDSDTVYRLYARPAEDAWKDFPGLTVVRRKVTYGPWVESPSTTQPR